MHDYASRLKSHLDSVNAYLAKAYPDGPLDEAADPESYVSNPLNALGMMWRDVSQFNDISNDNYIKSCWNQLHLRGPVHWNMML